MDARADSGRKPRIKISMPCAWSPISDVLISFARQVDSHVRLRSAIQGAEGATAIPDSTDFWGRNAFDPEFLPSGPKPLSNMNRQDGDRAHPSLGGDPLPLVGDYNNPILKPQAAAAVKKMGEIAAGGRVYPDPSNQCAPYSPPYIFRLQHLLGDGRFCRAL